jgi:hypothetical protein
MYAAELKIFHQSLLITSVTQPHQGTTDKGTEGSTDHYALGNAVSEKSGVNYTARFKC